jgi:hypothetical protein
MMDGLGNNMSGGVGWLGGLAAAVTGYRGYSNSEDRRETDRRFRGEIVRRLSEVKLELQRRAATAASNHKKESENEISSAVKEVQDLQDEIGQSSEGVVALFEVGDVEESQVDALYAYDRRILSVLEEMQMLFGKSGDSVPSGMLSRLDQLKKAVQERRRFLSGNMM